MKAILVITFSCALISLHANDSTTPDSSLAQLARDAISQNQRTSENAIRALRAKGPDGLRALLEANAPTLKAHTANPLPISSDSTVGEWLRLKAALDTVGQQRDCYASRLFWYTDFEQAKAAAKAGEKPILSLRLLGKLNEEFSCANSRFFRTTLYANDEVSRYLNEHFILHWKSVRPVPKVTIDFGDGRKLERTVTGNSIHYVLDSDGGVIDALPGLYGPTTFLRELNRAREISRHCSTLAHDAREQALREFHRARWAALKSEYAADLQKAGIADTPRREPTSVVAVSLPINPPTAQTAARVTEGKGRVERPILRATTPILFQPTAETDDARWQKIAALQVGNVRLDASSKALMRSKNPSPFAAGRLAATKMIVKDPLLRQIRNLERSIAEDTVRNEYLFHTQIHEWLANGPVQPQLDVLNARVYAELFLTPDSDPWLGLLPGDTYAALENDGIVLTSKQ